MSEDEFENHKRSLVVALLKRLENLTSETNSHWNQIVGRYYNFGSNKQDAETVRGITKPEIQEFYRTKIHTSSTERSKLVVQLFARSGSQPDEANSVTEGREPTVIKDVRKYKAGLVASTGPRPARDVTEFEEL